MLSGSIGEFLSEDVRAITRKVRGYRPLCFCIRALDIFQVIVLIAVGLVVTERGVRAKAVFVDIKADRLGQYAVAADFAVAGNADHILCGLVGNDVNNTRNGIAAIE